MAEFNSNEISKSIGKIIDTSLSLIADKTVIDIKKSISHGFPPASSPGQPPHLRTGDLLESIQRTKVKDHEVIIYSDSPYASYLEYGTQKLSPRPFFSPVAYKLEDEIEKVIEDMLMKEDI